MTIRRCSRSYFSMLFSASIKICITINLFSVMAVDSQPTRGSLIFLSSKILLFLWIVFLSCGLRSLLALGVILVVSSSYLWSTFLYLYLRSVIWRSSYSSYEIYRVRVKLRLHQLGQDSLVKWWISSLKAKPVYVPKKLSNRGITRLRHCLYRDKLSFSEKTQDRTGRYVHFKNDNIFTK